ncbi:MAG TPA: EAL domain-containing protein [Acidimicrobiales bacterium]|nr:EAL domain-containing protein [Acidimicrobiales bacterium]
MSKLGASCVNDRPGPADETMVKAGKRLVARAARRVANHRGEAAVVSVFMVAVGVGGVLTGATSALTRVMSDGAVAAGVFIAFATVWLPIAVIDFRRCTRETALRVKVEADLERHSFAARAKATREAQVRSRCEDVFNDGGPRIVYQPIVDVATREVVGYEALSRFDDGMPPDQWFAQASAVGLGVDLELSAVSNALECLPYLPETAYLSVNVSPDALYDPRLQSLVAGVSPGRVVVELTEHMPLADYSRCRGMVSSLRDAGARLAVDDAGAGYSSLRHIVDLGPDIIKLDQSLVRSVHLAPARRSVMSAFVSFARDLQATLVAEGVEELDEEHILRQWGLGFAQGWLYGRPVGLDVLRLGTAVLLQPTSVTS